MRLLHVKRLEFAEFRDENRPPYVIASHRWHEGTEATYQEVLQKSNVDKLGYKKIQQFASFIERNIPEVEWFWIDTCCIDKTSAAELSKSINLMFDWYHGAEICIVYLSDVSATQAEETFANSIWFTRGWTLQELLASQTLIFVSEEWHIIGSKGSLAKNRYSSLDVPRWEPVIAKITGIPEHVLYDFKTSSSLSVEERLKWMDGRITTEEEDMSYALYGIFDVSPGANYGEKHERARRRLLAEINHQTDLATQRNKRFREIVDWLSPADPWTNHNSARRLHMPQSGKWLLETRQYQNWKSGCTRHIWLYGKPGCGKTILCSTAIEDIKHHCESHTGARYAAFYFSFSDKRKQGLTDLLRSLLEQLSWKEPAYSMLRRVYDKPNRSPLGLEDLEKILLASFSTDDETFLLIDALDECPVDEDTRHDLMEYLGRLSEAAPSVKILATSREMPDVRTTMLRLRSQPFALDTHSVNAEIKQYVAKGLSSDHGVSRLNQETKTLIEETLSSKADGMFRWAFCQVQELKRLKFKTPKFVKEVLFNLPKSLDETYERMLVAIDKPWRIHALKLLRWLAYARSPLSLGKLAETNIINFTEDGDVYIDVDNRPGLDDVLEILSGLVIAEHDNWRAASSSEQEEMSLEASEIGYDDTEIVDHLELIDQETKIRLAHFSVKEYLESERILVNDANEFHLCSGREHRILCHSCLGYLTHYSDSEKKLLSTDDLTTFPFLHYAATSWFYHSGRQETTDTNLREVNFLGDNQKLCDWLRIYEPDILWYGPFENWNGETGSPLYYACFLGLEILVNSFLQAQADVNAQGGEYGNALQAASLFSRERVVQMLIDAGADVNAQGGEYGNALQAASLDGREGVVQMLIDAGADVNAQRGEYGNALQAASRNGYERVVQMLIDAGADVNAQGGEYGNALQAASLYGYKGVVQILINAGADVNAQGGEYDNALQAASMHGYKGVVQMLVDAGADVNAQGGVFGNALQAASLDGHKEVVQMLINAGADFNAQGGQYGNALQAASRNGHERAVQMLIDAGADVNAQGGEYGNALQAASLYGREGVVQMLIDAGADVNAQGGEYGNALQAASLYGREGVVQMLIDAGADVNAQGGEYGNALQAASMHGHKGVVQMLVDAGADVNAQGGVFGNALQAASLDGHEEVVQLLINAGADVNAQGGHYDNALQAASRNYHEEIVQMLIDAGAKS